MTYRLSSDAEADLIQIIDYIAEHDEAAADRLYQDFVAAFRLLGQRPHIGHPRRDLTSRDLRFWTVRRHWMVAHQCEDPVEIVAVLAARRDLVSLLR